MSRFRLDEYRKLVGYQYEGERSEPQPTRTTTPPVVESQQPKKQSVRAEIKELKDRLSALENRVEGVQEEVKVVRQDVRKVQEDQHGLVRLVNEARYATRTVFLPQERVVFRDRPAQHPVAAQMEAAIRNPPKTEEVRKPQEEIKGDSRWRRLEVDE